MDMKFEEYTDVVLITDRYESDGFKRGMIGTIVDVYGDGEAYEVDFTNVKHEGGECVDGYYIVDFHKDATVCKPKFIIGGSNNEFLFRSFQAEDLRPWTE